MKCAVKDCGNNVNESCILNEIEINWQQRCNNFAYDKTKMRKCSECKHRDLDTSISHRSYLECKLNKDQSTTDHKDCWEPEEKDNK